MRHASKRKLCGNNQTGFSLVELMVVMAILLIVVSQVDWSIGGSDISKVRNEADRLALLLRTAQEQAIMQGKPIVFEIKDANLAFYSFNSKGELAALEDDNIFKPGKFRKPVELDESEVNGVKQGKSPRIALLPTGNIMQFRLTLKYNDAYWWVTGTTQGQIQSEAPVIAGKG